MQKILFISHDATLTGAPILLLNLIRLLKTQKPFSIKLVIKNGSGQLLQTFENEVETIIWKKEHPSGVFRRATRKMAKVLHLKDRQSKQIQTWIHSSDLVISNTLTNGDFFAAFNFTGVKHIFTYAHELEMATQFFTNPRDLQFVTSISHRFLVPSMAVANHLTQNLLVPARQISKLNYYIPLADAPVEKFSKESVFTVGIAGTLDWRKGADLLAVVVASFFSKYPSADVQFVWQGVATHTVEYERTLYELKKLDLSGKVRLLPSTKEMSEFYTSINVLLLLSKEDPYPLVILEAAKYFKPCICFRDTGGGEEFIQNDAGDSLPFLNIEQLSEALYSYYKDDTKVSLKGKAAHAKYKSLHNNPALIISQLSDAIAENENIQDAELVKKRASTTPPVQ